jgi:hypothetical protein
VGKQRKQEGSSRIFMRGDVGEAPTAPASEARHIPARVLDQAIDAKIAAGRAKADHEKRLSLFEIELMEAWERG